MKVPRLTARWIGPVAALVALAAVAVLVASAGVGARTARADTTTTVCPPSTDVTIDTGPICGLTVGATNEWFGIPYAAPPVGALRWQPPQAPTPWTKHAVRRRSSVASARRASLGSARVVLRIVCS